MSGRFCRLVGKGNEISAVLSLRALKYTLLASAACLAAGAVFGRGLPAAGSAASRVRAVPGADTSDMQPLPPIRHLGGADTIYNYLTDPPSDYPPPGPGRDTLIVTDAEFVEPSAPILGPDSMPASDTTRKKSFLDDPISGTSKDSLVYDVKNKVVYIYKDGDVKYQTMNMKADFMRVEMDTKEMYAYGVTDSLGNKTRPEFIDNGASYTMDTITYNIDTKKAKIKGVATQEGEGFLLGDNVKKMSDNTINIKRGRYTTCDNIDHPHFYLQMSRAKVIPGKKVIADYSYMVMEDVPIIFPGLPEGFFPMTTGRKSGIIVPSFGEENQKGFFLRDGGYYFAISDYIDLTVLGGIYTLGSWEARVQSRYIRRYKYSGNIQAHYAKNVLGDEGTENYIDNGSFQLRWTHQQDPKFRPNSTFSASVDFTTAGYQKYGSTNIADYLNTQTNSSVSYSHTWAGTPFSLSMSMQVSQNAVDTTMSFSLPNINFNMSRIFPFRRKNAVGKQRWYEKISMQYTMNFNNSVVSKEEDMFRSEMFKKIKSGVQHNIPVQASFNLFNYINITPQAQYTERWYFRKIEQEWDPVRKSVVPSDTTYGFYRVYNYSFSASANTKIYGTYQFKNPKSPLQAVRHTLTPTISFQYVPDFSKQKYGYYKPVQSNEQGDIRWYTPFSDVLYGVPSGGRQMNLSFGLSQTLEIKVLSKTDTAGIKKVKLIDDLSIRGSYNFLADSLNLSVISISLRSTLPGNIGLQVSATLDPYEVDKSTGRRINRFMFRRGKPGRIASVNWAFGYTFNSNKSATPAINDINSQFPEYTNPFYFDPDNPIDPTLRRQMMTATYYNFDIPWNFGFNYSVNYSNNGVRKNVTQTLGFNASVNLTPKWGITFTSGYDFIAKKLTTGVFTLTRDLHCWQMSFNWVPIGFRKSWSFNISVKSALLRDLKYDKQSSYYDNIFDQM